MLFHRECIRMDARASRARIADVNAAFAGGKPATDRLSALGED